MDPFKVLGITKEQYDHNFNIQLKKVLSDPNHKEIVVKNSSPHKNKEVRDALASGVKNIILIKRNIFGKKRIVGMCGVS